MVWFTRALHMFRNVNISNLWKVGLIYYHILSLLSNISLFPVFPPLCSKNINERRNLHLIRMQDEAALHRALEANHGLSQAAVVVSRTDENSVVSFKQLQHLETP